MEDLIYRAKLCEQSERYENMVQSMKQLIPLVSQLTVEQRNLLSVGYKNTVGVKRNALRTLAGIEKREHSRGNAKHVELAKLYKEKVERELVQACEEVVQIIDQILSSKRNDYESQVFFLKMKGDYYRYEAEFGGQDTNNNQSNSAANKAMESYRQAMNLCKGEAQMPPTHPIRLGLALNYSVFYYEVQKQPDEACVMAREAFDAAIAELDSLNEEQYKDSTTIMQLIRDNLTLWASEMEEDPRGGSQVEQQQKCLQALLLLRICCRIPRGSKLRRSLNRSRCMITTIICIVNRRLRAFYLRNMKRQLLGVVRVRRIILHR